MGIVNENEDVLVEVKNLSLKFPVLVKKQDDLKLWSIGNRQNIEYVQALNNVSFTLKKGDRLGLMGRNGAGKTTLLKTIAGAIPTSSGTITTHGRITNLINTSIGIHPEANGYENILLRWLYMDVPIKKMKSLVDEIIDFSELEDAINKPIYTYSAGMKARLELSIALAIKPEILLMDEWLGRGDPQFQDKAAKKLTKFVDEAGILILASHSEKLLYRLCNRIIHMSDGEIAHDQEVDEEQKAQLLATPKEKAIARKIAQKREDKRQAKIKESQAIKISMRRKLEAQQRKIKERRKQEIKQEKIKARRKLEIQKEKARAKRQQGK